MTCYHVKKSAEYINTLCEKGPKTVKKIAATKQVGLDEKPYNICLDCPYLGETCDGPNFLGMTYRRWVEWCTERKKMLNLTHAEIADRANIGKSTVDNIFSGRAEDTRMSTMQAITKALVGGCWGQYPCHYASLHLSGAESPEIRIKDLEERLSAAEKDAHELEELREQVKGARERRETAVAKAEEDAQKKIDFLREQIAFKEKTILDSREMMKSKDRTIKILGILIGALGAVLLALLVADAVIPNMGWFRF